VAALLRRAVAFFALNGMAMQQLLTDTGSGYRALGYRSPAGRSVSDIWARVLTTPAHVERFIRTLLGGWAYDATYSDKGERTAAFTMALVVQPSAQTLALGHKPLVAELLQRTKRFRYLHLGPLSRAWPCLRGHAGSRVR
jgi:hypothetical protein